MHFFLGVLRVNIETHGFDICFYTEGLVKLDAMHQYLA